MLKEYILPIVFAGVGAYALLHGKKEKVAQELFKPNVPKSRSTSWGTSSVTNHDIEPTSPSRVALFQNSATLPKTKSQTMPDASYIFFQDKLMDLSDCLTTKHCQFSNKDPKSYEIEIYAEMARTLRTLGQWQKRNNYKDERIPELMRNYISFDNADIKIEALKLLASQPAEPENLNVVLDEVIQFSQPEPIELGMRELARYRRPEEKRRIDDTLEKILLRGGIYSAIEVAKYIKPLVDNNNASRYRGILSSLQKTPLSRDIAEALDENI